MTRIGVGVKMDRCAPIHRTESRVYIHYIVVQNIQYIQFNSIQFNIYCIKYSHIYSNTVTKKNHEFSEEVDAK